MNKPPPAVIPWPASLSRRSLLKSMLAASATLTLAGAASSCARHPGADASGRRYLFLDENEAAVLSAAGEAVIPTQGGFPTLAQAEVVRRFDEEISFVGESIRSDLRAAIGALQVAPFVYGSFSRFSKLDVEGRRAVMKSMMDGRSDTLRAVATNLKLLVHFFYFGHPASWKAMGYDGPFGHLPPMASEQRRHYAEATGGVTS